jgi:ArsR family transcriptional regulator, zinc-responsive transcriptional repressor
MAAKPKLLPIQNLCEATECLKIMAHPVRLRIVEILMQGRFQVHEIARLCDLAPHQTSEHLRLLQGRGLLAAERDGRSVYYRIADRRLPSLIGCIRSTCGASARLTVGRAAVDGGPRSVVAAMGVRTAGRDGARPSRGSQA